jgi:branched-chain amino acid transport system permease protein
MSSEILLSGLRRRRGIGAVFGLRRCASRGFYLAVATLARSFFLSWCFVRVPWLVNYNISNAIECRPARCSTSRGTGPNATRGTRYLVVLSIVVAMTWNAAISLRGRIGRTWMAVRDMDIAPN